MVSWRILTMMFLVVIGIPFAAAESSSLPIIKSRINDHAMIISQSQRHQLYQLLAQHEHSNHKSVVVVTTDTAGSDSVAEYAKRIWQVWESKKKPTSVLLVLFKQQKSAAIVAGESLKIVLDAQKIEQITNDQLSASLSRNDYDSAVMEGVQAIVNHLNN